MKVKIIKGTNQIGGCITEITSSKNTKIIIDYGMDLEPTKYEKININWKDIKAVFITHIHDDHIGLINEIPSYVDVYVEKESFLIYQKYLLFTNKTLDRKIHKFKINSSKKIDDIKITNYIVDHSAFNSVMYYIEADNKSILHMGDFRTNGNKGPQLEKTLKKIGHADILIMEGTTLSREDKINETENELYLSVRKTMQEYPHVLLLQSSTNIDRIVTMFKASKSTNHTFIEDIFTANITNLLIKHNIPNPKTFGNDVRIYVPKKRDNNKTLVNKKYVLPLKDEMIYGFLRYSKKKWTLMVKTSMIKDIDMFDSWNILNKENTCLIYSMWDGYMEKGDVKEFVDYIKSKGIKIIKHHTSGHADSKARDLVINTITYNGLLPIHTEEKDKYKDLFPNVIDIEDGKEIEVK